MLKITMVLFVLKIIALGAWIASENNWLRLGEAKIIAQDEDTQNSSSSTDADLLQDLLNIPDVPTSSATKDDLTRYMQIIEARRKKIDDQSLILRERLESLKNLENSIDQKLQQLDEERLYFAQTLQKEKELKGERLEKLVKLYAKMEPKKAAAVFEQMDKDLVIALFQKISEKQIMTVLENMQPQKSVELSEYFARMRSANEYNLLKEMNQSLRQEFEECKTR